MKTCTHYANLLSLVPLAAGNVPLQMERTQYSSITNRAEHHGTSRATGIKATGGEYGCCNFFEVPVTVSPVNCIHGCISSIGCYLPEPYVLEVTSGFSYQWKKNGVNISGATFNSYSVAHPGLPSNFGVYSVVVSDGTNTVTLNPFATIVAAPDISWCPQRLEENAIVDSASGLIIYPNPNEGYFTLLANKFIGQDVVVEIYNTLGAQVYRKEFKSYSGATSVRLADSKAEGLYIVRVISNKKSETAKMNINEIH